MKRWLAKYAEPLTHLVMFILLLVVGSFHLRWVSSVCIGVAWWMVLKQWDQVKRWRRRALIERTERVRIEEALDDSGMRMVSICQICNQRVLDFDEHYTKIHTTKGVT